MSTSVTKYSTRETWETIYDPTPNYSEIAALWYNQASVRANDGYYSYADCYCKYQGSGLRDYYIEGSHRFVAKSFGFAVPTGATIISATVNIEAKIGKTSPFTHSCELALRDGSTNIYATTLNLTTSDTTTNMAVGGSLLTPAIVNSSNFNVTFRKRLETCTSSQYSSYAGSFRVTVDYIKVTIVYACPYTAECYIITTTIDDTAPLGAPYSATLLANTGSGTTWTLASGTIPPGLALSSSGVISGTPTLVGQYPFTVLATYDCDPTLTDSADYIIIVACDGYYAEPPTVLPSFVQGTTYSTTLTAVPDTSKLWTVTAGAFPTGVTITAATGVIAGTPSAVGSWVGSVSFKCTWANGCAVSFTLSGEYTKYATVSDTINNATIPTDTIAQSVASASYETAKNDVAYVLNIRTGDWVYIDNMPFSSALYRADDNSLIGTRQDTGTLSKINSGSKFDSTAICSSLQTGFMDFGDLDETKEMPPQFSEALKRARALFCDVKSEENLYLTVYSEQNSTGIAFTITPTTTDNVIYNTVRRALSRDLRGKYFSLKIANYYIDTTTLLPTGYGDFWIGEMALKVLPRNVR